MESFPTSISVSELEEKGCEICPLCRQILSGNNGIVRITCADGEIQCRPVLWRHSVNDCYHAWVKVNDRHVILCATNEFDELSLKRVRPMSRKEQVYWKIYIGGSMYYIIEHDGNYEILNEDGTIVKDEKIEAMVFNHITGQAANILSEI